VIAPRTLVRARKQIGYVVHAATGKTTNARINTDSKRYDDPVGNSIRNGDANHNP
jgi:hypothetical protein